MHSKEEQDFISEFLFKTKKISENVWLGLKKNDNNFKWSDGSNLEFANWLTGNPSNKSDHNCVQVLPESSPIGKWSDITCNKKNVAICQKIPTLSLTLLHKMYLETKKELEDRKQTLMSTTLKLDEISKEIEEIKKRVSFVLSAKLI
jgi:hypothetical protein